MAKKEDSKQDKPINWTQLSIQEIEDIAKQAITKQNRPFNSLNQQLSNNMNNYRQDAEYTKEEILQMRENNDNRLYKSPIEVTSSYGCVWENGKVGYFIPFDHKPLSGDFLPAKFGGGQRDGKGLRFVQNHKDSDKTLFLFTQNNDIIVSGFGEYVLQNWGSDINVLYKDYANLKYKKLAEQWRNKNFPKKIDQLVKLNLLKNLRELEIKKWNEATISDFLTKSDNIKLKFCIDELNNWLDTCVQFENNRGEIEYVKNIQLQKITIGNGWANGKSGQFNDFDNNYQFRFCETDENGYHYLLNDEEQRNLPVLACGFVAWLIKHWGTDTHTIYTSYFQTRLNQYKAEHKYDADLLKRNLDQEFTIQYKSNEEKWVKQSEVIFDFISEKEVTQIKQYTQYYFEYFESLINPLKIDEYTKESEILKCTIPNIKQIYSVLKKFSDNGEFSPLVIINDLRRVEQYYQSKPDECIEYIASKYKMRWAVSTRFIECLKLIIDEQSDFMFLLRNQSFMILLLKNVQIDFAKNFNILLAENTENSNLSNTNEPERTNLDIESLKEDSLNFKLNGNEALILKIHEHCNNDIFICNDTDFVNCVMNANFSLLQIKTKSKVKLLIYYLSKQMGAIWYEQTAKSLGYEKSDCSGANVTDSKWKKQIQRIIPQ